ncbi:MAG: SEC-C domain-containing protein [Pseudomonadota bacterium]
MASDNLGTAGVEDAERFEFVIGLAVCNAIATDDPDGFLDWFTRFFTLGDYFPELLERMGAVEATRSMAAVLGRIIWNRTPRPDNHFRPRPLPKPERNQPCICGSGRKYKQCCGPIAPALEAQFEHLSLLRYVLDTLPEKELKNLPFDYLSKEELAVVAQDWIGEGRHKRAARLLEPLFDKVEALDERAEMAFDILNDCYLELDNPRKKARLIEKVLASSNRTLRSAALHRQIVGLFDHGDQAGAWRLFQEAQRFDPDNPALARLEITLLMFSGDPEKTQERARFWLARLERDRSRDHGGLTAWLRGVVGDVESATQEAFAAGAPWVGSLFQLVEALPPLECHYKLEPEGGSAGPLVEDAKLRKIEQQWGQVFPAAKPMSALAEPEAPDAWEDLAWLAWLESNPLALQDFDVLDDLVMALGDLEFMHEEMRSRLRAPLLNRAVELLRLVLAKNRAEGFKLEWGFLDNRPALRLLATCIREHLAEGRRGEAVALMEWMVGTLNPHDNHGFREDLARAYLELGMPEKAVALSDRYPNDFPAMALNRILALYQTGRVDDARAELKALHVAYPEMLKMLLAENPRKPKVHEGYVTLGGKDAGWFYRAEYRELWVQSGALAWAAGLGLVSPRKAQ